ncbi:unnamed protein product, partial [marine sediment metagenome]
AIIAIALVLMILLYGFVKHTAWGRAMRAVSDDREAAEAIGINVNRAVALTFAIGSAFGAIGGILIGLEQDIEPIMGITIGFKAFTASVLGGIGSIAGALLGGFSLGIVENLGAGYISSAYKDAIAFIVLIMLLVFRPSGLLAVKRRWI